MVCFVLSKPCPRVFVVGCARSGTTLLQAMLCAHSNVISFPESQFFANLVDQYDDRVMGDVKQLRKKILYIFQELLLKMGLTPRPYSGICAINRFLAKAKVSGDDVSLDLRYYRLKPQIDFMINLLDRAAGEAGKSSWLLKTPSNISYIDVIQDYVNEAKFVHIVRPGRDVVASIYDAAVKHPDTVWKHHFYKGSLQRIANMWNASVSQSVKYANHDDHLIVAYESLIDDPEKELSRIFEFLGIKNEPGCSVRYKEQAIDIVSGNEKWKKGVSGNIEKIDKYETLFNAEQKSILQAVLDDVDIQRISGS